MAPRSAFRTMGWHPCCVTGVVGAISTAELGACVRGRAAQLLWGQGSAVSSALVRTQMRGRHKGASAARSGPGPQPPPGGGAKAAGTSPPPVAVGSNPTGPNTTSFPNVLLSQGFKSLWHKFQPTVSAKNWNPASLLPLCPLPELVSLQVLLAGFSPPFLHPISLYLASLSRTPLSGKVALWRARGSGGVGNCHFDCP